MKQELDVNHQLSQRLIAATENGNSLMQQNIKVKTGLTARCNPNATLKNRSPS